MKRLTLLVVAVFLGLSAGGCGKSNDEKQKEADKKVTKGEFQRSTGKAY